MINSAWPHLLLLTNTIYFGFVLTSLSTIHNDPAGFKVNLSPHLSYQCQFKLFIISSELMSMKTLVVISYRPYSILTFHFHFLTFLNMPIDFFQHIFLTFDSGFFLTLFITIRFWNKWGIIQLTKYNTNKQRRIHIAAQWNHP